MISIIICSVNDEFARQVSGNIEKTIGVAYEIIVYNNSRDVKGICQVYNECALKAKYELLCFVHEDVLFQSQDWGKKIMEYFSTDPELGLIGVAGSKYKSKTVSGWYTGIREFDCCNIYHLEGGNEKHRIYFTPDENKNEHDVVTLDGVFICCRRNVWEEVKFNGDILKGFHLYDLDFSLRASRRYRVMVTFEISLIHIVKGNHYGNAWLRETLLWHKWGSALLPAIVPGDFAGIRNKEGRIRREWLIRLKHEKLHFTNKLKWLSACDIWKDIMAWPFVIKFLFRARR